VQMSSRCDYRSGMNDAGKYLPFRKPWREPRQETTEFPSQKLSRRKPLKETEFIEEIQAVTIRIPMSASPTVPVLNWSSIAVKLVTGAQRRVHSRNVEFTGRHVEFTSARRSSQALARHSESSPIDKISPFSPWRHPTCHEGYVWYSSV